MSRALETKGPWSIRNSKQDRRRSTTFVAFQINIANDDNIIHVVHMNARAIVEDKFSVHDCYNGVEVKYGLDPNRIHPALTPSEYMFSEGIREEERMEARARNLMNNA